MRLLKSARIFASNYQIMITDSFEHDLTDEMNWDDEKCEKGFAGDSHTLLVSTEADLNDHWVDVYQSDTQPNIIEYQLVYSLYFNCRTGKLLVSSVIDDVPTIEADIDRGDYTIIISGNNIGVDQLSLGEETELTDLELKERLDLERYCIFVVPGKPLIEGKIRDIA